jgi:ribosomal protein S18 acetylase RimI-like enzyme
VSEHWIRPVGPRDFDAICRHRHEMFKVSGRSDEMVAPMTEHFGPWLRPRLADGRYFGWFIESAERTLGGVGMMVIDWPPHPSHPSQSARGYVLNMFVEPDCRRLGLGRQLMEICRGEGERRGLDYLVLHATSQGRGLYEKLGWAATTEMGLGIRP